MPIENRDIFFTENELKIALMHFSARKGLKFKTENITEFNVIIKDPFSINMKVFDVAHNKTGTVNFSNPEIVASMMGYCMYLKIPLPKAGKKSLQVNGSELYLKVTLE